MLVSFIHTGIELALWLLILRTIQIKLVKSNPEGGGSLALSYLLGS